MVVLDAVADGFIKFSKTKSAFDALSAGFESMYGFPDAVGAVDRSIFRIEQSFEYKGYVNKQWHFIRN